MLAVIICCIGGGAVVQIFERVQRTSGLQRAGWTFLTAIATGATIWCTHFVAMIAYRTTVPVHLSPVLTLISLIVAIVGASAGLTLSVWRSSRLFPPLGGALLGATIAAMHYTGMAAYRVDGIVEWRPAYVAMSVLLGIALSSLSFGVLCSTSIKRHRIVFGTTLFVAAIASLHFTAMTALRIVPLALSDTPLSNEGMQALGLATALVGLLVICAAIVAALVDRQTRSAAIQRLHHMAMNDSLTGLPNRRSFQAELQHQVSQARSQGTQLAVIAIDLDRFKEINDTHGHKAGDDVLAAVAGRLCAALPNGTVARLGGDEFVALLRFEHQELLCKALTHLDSALKQPLVLQDFEARIGASVGVAIFPKDAEHAEELTNNADLAMYRAKREGSPEPRFYDALLDEAIRERRELANDLRQAIEARQLQLHYQVQASVATQEVTGYEALLRWRHPIHGNISPADFISIAEEHGLIVRIGEWVLRQACSDAMTWQHPSKVAVNVSPLQLSQANLPEVVQQILLETGLPARRLEIELTESAIMADRDRALEVLQKIKALGVCVALDDFGTGYSSLETLRVFPFDKIKLDRFFISGITDSQESIAIVRAVLALGKSLSIPVLAEGIETDEQFETLHREGCDEAQGFLLGRPKPSSDHAQTQLSLRSRGSRSIKVDTDGFFDLDSARQQRAI
ncbi:MAG: bifunctional diguanylate cyclase/phosphodiesterase [Steroidobacteraceae bacterium]